ncbi:hypothetical protein GE300_05465 [Rhodobacteraceae bacterium 2CG4]|uniref:Uncharacterized protein n=1 Tax=Halovulum marinum TaxID=2662447 RepID=A0A6L5YZ18_9RHOB|nr:AsmA-like C-terminal region-containing protein [Halovulum marinum]MSU89075.1 hypothetical protein [Halovulum marinum]
MKAKRLQDSTIVPARAPRARLRGRLRGRARPGPGAAFCGFCLREVCSALTKLVTAAVILAAGLMLLLQDGTLSLARIAPEVSRLVAGRLGADDVRVGDMSLTLGAGEGPAGLTLSNVRIGGLAGGGTLEVPRMATGFSMADSLRGRIRPRTLDLDGIGLKLRRGADGALHLVAADGAAPVRIWPPAGSGGGDMQAFLRAVSGGALGGGRGGSGAGGPLMLDALEQVRFGQVALRFEDARTGARWRADDAGARLLRDGDFLSGSVNAVLRRAGAAPVPVLASVSRNTRIGRTRYQLRFENARPADLAGQVAVLDWLSVIDAPVSGALAAEVADDGTLLSLAGRLQMGQGAVTPLPGRRFGFDGAGAYFTWDPDRSAFDVTRLRLDTAYGALTARGTVLVERSAAGGVASLTGQLALSDLTLAANPGRDAPLRFTAGEALARVTLDPFRIELGRLAVRGDAGSAEVSGKIAALPDRWQLALDASAEGLEIGQVLAGWPETALRNVRRFVSNRVSEGRVRRLDAFLRADGGRPEVGLDLAFDGGRARLVDGMPPLVGAAGRAQLVGDRFDLVLEQGRSGPGAGAGLDLAGSRFAIADVRQDPPLGRATVTGRGGIPQMLALIDNPPLRLLSRAGLDAGLARGRVAARAVLDIPLIDGLRADDIGIGATATLTDVASDTLARGRPLRADRLTLTADRETLRVEGPVTVSGVPVQAAFRRDLGPDAGPAEVRGTLDVTAETAAGLGIPLPPGTLGGRGAGSFVLTLPTDRAPVFQADVALGGLSLAIPALGWRKAAASDGRLTLRGALSDPPRVDRIALSGPGLTLEGSLDLAAGRLAGASLDRLRLGGWLDAPVRWRAGGDVAIRGGRIDLRRGLPATAAAGGGGRIALDGTEVVIADRIRLTGLSGTLAPGAAGADRFRARVNGAAPVSGVIADDGQIYLQSDEGGGGAVLAAAGLNRNVQGGTLRVTVAPGEGGPLTGGFSMQDARLVNAPVMAQMLSGLSVIGLAERLAGPGILFRDAQGRFAIDRGRVHVRDARAVGASLGVTVDGVYDTNADALDLGGVVSPVYMLNGMVQRLAGIGALLGGRPGEGLLGANFRVTGRAAAPQVSVNPLSLLTPGATRGLFQSRSRAAPGG